MIISTEREGAEARLVAALRATFDASVMNFGSYNLLYAENLLGEPIGRGAGAASEQTGDETSKGAEREHRERGARGLSVQEQVSQARHLLVGYRREPVEMVLCPVGLQEALPRAAGADGHAEPSVPLPVNLTNLAGMAVEGTRVELVLSTGHRVRLEVQPAVSFTGLDGTASAGTALNQHRDVEDFYAFVDHFMDRVEDIGS